MTEYFVEWLYSEDVTLLCIVQTIDEDDVRTKIGHIVLLPPTEIDVRICNPASFQSEEEMVHWIQSMAMATRRTLTDEQAKETIDHVARLIRSGQIGT